MLTNHSSVYESRDALLSRELPTGRASGLRGRAVGEAVRKGEVVAGEVSTYQKAEEAKSEDGGEHEDGSVHTGKSVQPHAVEFDARDSCPGSLHNLRNKESSCAKGGRRTPAVMELPPLSRTQLVAVSLQRPRTSARDFRAMTGLPLRAGCASTPLADYPPRAVAIGDQPNMHWSGWDAVDGAVHNLQALPGERSGVGMAGSADDEEDVDDDHATGFDEIGLQRRLRKAIVGVFVDASQLDEQLLAPVTHRVDGLDRRFELLAVVVGRPER